MQIVVNAADLKVICFSVSKGKTYDFNLFKNSRLPILKHAKILADSGYQGINKYHKNSETPIKASKNINFQWKKNNIIIRFQKGEFMLNMLTAI
ncbi:MAG: transposase [Acutalibacteraceae bacterium]